MRDRIRLVAALALAAIAITPHVHAQSRNQEIEQERAEREQERQEEIDEREEDAYERGLDYLDDRKYDAAIRQFDRVTALGRSRAPGALYWKAWAQRKLNRRTDALATLAALEKQYPRSAWSGDARALELEVRQASGQSVSPERVEDEELKLIALHSLMQDDPERAITTLEKVLRGSGSLELKKQALFVLSQSRSPRAAELLSSAASGGMNPDLQMEAIEYIGIMGGTSHRALLEKIYTSTTSEQVRERILESFMLAGDRERILRVAKGDRNPRLRAVAVEQLGIMGARGELEQLYVTETSTDVKEQIIEALFLGGASDTVTRLAKEEKDPDLRAAAIEALGLMGPRTASTLVELYRKETDRELREEIIDALFIQGNDVALVGLARAEKDRQLKREIVERLSLMSGKAAKDYLRGILGE